MPQAIDWPKHGSWVALVTPMHENGQIDLPCLKHLIQWHEASGTQGIVILGTTGESSTIETAERNAIIRCAVSATTSLPIMVGTGCSSTQKSIADTQTAMDLGAHACLIVTPYYNKPTQTGLMRHFLSIADAVPIPQILYNVPHRTGCDLLPQTLAHCVKHPHILGIKDATGDLNRLKENQRACQEHPCYYYSGDDHTALDFITQGGHGVISVTANLMPKTMAQLMQFLWSGQHHKAALLHAQLMPLTQHLFVEPNPIPIKWALHHRNQIPPGIRLPLHPLSTCHQERLVDIMALCSE